ncbi:MAG TPA: hypothetical protein P5016_13945 [Verrucomicrobiales bacterium]|nr:hypothetical protein [Verrucomicrobiales bacterium]
MIEKIIGASSLWSVFILFSPSIAVGGDLLTVTAPPGNEVVRLALPSFYRKYTAVRGFPIVSSGKVSDYALREAGFLIDALFEGCRPPLVAALVQAKIRFAIMAPDEFTSTIPEHSHLEPKAYWDRRSRGVGSTWEHPAVSCGEENLLDLPGDPYASESILIHEMAHTIHLQGLAVTDPGFDGRLRKAYESAVITGLWKGTYAVINKEEYWAEGVQSWFDGNRENDFEHNQVNTREELKSYDPALAKLLREIFGDGPWRYQKPRNRGVQSHLAGFRIQEAPRFVWPQALGDAFDAWKRGDHWVRLRSLPLGAADEIKVSARSNKPVTLRIDNELPAAVTIFWVDFEGRPEACGTVAPLQSFLRDTFSGSLWMVKDEQGKVVGRFQAGDNSCLATLRENTSSGG